MNKVNSEKIKKVSIICSKGSLEGVYPSLIMANGARMEGIEADLFFTFFGLDAVIKSRYNSLKVATVGNPALRLPGGIPMPTLLGAIPGMSSVASMMMKAQMEELDIPPIPEFIKMISDSGGNLFVCKASVDMFKLKKEDFCDEVQAIITVGEFYERSAESSIIFT